MKKCLLVLVAVFFLQQSLYAQEHAMSEVRLNFLNLIALGKVEVGYEKFIAKDQSLGLELHLNDRYAYRSTNSDRRFSTTALQLSYQFYFAGENDHRVFLFPFFKYRFGEFVEPTRVTNMNSGLIGLGGGYKWAFNDKFSFGPFASIARGFSEEVQNRFSAVEYNLGFTVGVRF
jgi:hypothetical protein